MCSVSSHCLSKYKIRILVFLVFFFGCRIGKGQLVSAKEEVLNSIEFIEIKGGNYFSKIHNAYFKINSFRISVLEITFEQYDEYCKAMDLTPPDDEGWGRGQRPVINISVKDAEKFCKWLGPNYRIPSIVEWEYACSSGTDTKYYTGNTLTTIDANYNGNSTRGVYRQKTLPVGSFLPNSYGLQDMYGNVAEYVIYDNSVYAVGGSWDSNPEACEPIARKKVSEIIGNNAIGFRIVYSLESISEVYADFSRAERERLNREQEQERNRSIAEKKEDEEKKKKNLHRQWYDGFQLAVAGKLSTLGYGGEIVFSMSSWIKCRAGYTVSDYNPTLKFGVDHYKHDSEASISTNFNSRHVHLLFDVLPGKRSPFHFTFGLYTGNNVINADGYVTDNGSPDWTVDILGIKHGDNYYELDVRSGNFYDVEVRFANNLKPYLGIGFGRSVPKKAVGLKLDIGFVYQGDFFIYQHNERIDPIYGADLPGFSLPNINRDLMKWWPVINLQLGFRL